MLERVREGRGEEGGLILPSDSTRARFPKTVPAMSISEVGAMSEEWQEPR
jgi:hypothetical protein